MAAERTVHDIGDDRQLFLDDRLLERRDGVSFDVHRPVGREVVLEFDRPWEGSTSWCPVVHRDGDRFRMWYRAQGEGAGEPDTEGGHSFTAYAESADGVEWERPALGRVSFRGSRENNIVIDEDVRNVGVLRDPSPGEPGARYKAVGRTGSGSLAGLVSPDGIEWESLGVLIEAPDDDPQFDSPVSVFWDPRIEAYRLYVRGWYPDGPRRRIRAIRTAVSGDFREWSDLEYVTIADWESWRAHLYTNAAHRYPRAPVYLMTPKRFVPDRHADPERFPDWPHDGLSDVLLFASRDGEHWRQVGDGAFIRPGRDPDNWHDRAVTAGPNVVQTGEDELSVYVVENYRTPTIHVRRFTLRTDGFVSAHAGNDGGSLTTEPLTFEGSRLAVNCATSAAGRLRVGLLDGRGDPVAGHSTAHCEDVVGDHVDRTVRWGGDADVGGLAGDPVRLRFQLSEADLYSFRFLEP